MIDRGILICDTKPKVNNKLLNCIKVIIKLQEGEVIKIETKKEL